MSTVFYSFFNFFLSFHSATIYGSFTWYYPPFNLYFMQKIVCNPFRNIQFLSDEKKKNYWFASSSFWIISNGEGGIWTLAPLLTTYSLSRGAPSANLGTSPKCPLFNIHDISFIVQYFFSNIKSETFQYFFKKTLKTFRRNLWADIY